MSFIIYSGIIQDTVALTPIPLSSDSITKDSTTVVLSPAIKINKHKKVGVKKDENSALPNFFFTTYNKNLKANYKNFDSQGWILPLLLFVFFFIGIINRYFYKESRTLFTGVFKKDGFKKLLEEENVMIRRTVFMFILLFLIVLPLFTYQTYFSFKGDLSYIPLIPPYIQILLIISAALGLKLFSIRFFGYIFSSNSIALSYISNILIASSISGLLLIPITLCIKIAGNEISSILIYVGVALLSATYVISLLIGIISGIRNEKLSNFHLILYFCTLEILPVFIIVKTMKVLN